MYFSLKMDYFLIYIILKSIVAYCTFDSPNSFIAVNI